MRVEVRSREFITKDNYQIECWKTEGTEFKSSGNPSPAWYDCHCGLLVQRKRALIDEGNDINHLWQLEDTDVRDFKDYLDSPLAMSDPLEIVRNCEDRTRDFIIQVMETKLGSNWWESSGLPTEKTRKINGLKADREKQSIVKKPAINYTTFGELTEIIRSNRKVFAERIDTTKLEKNLNNISSIRSTKLAHGSGRMTKEDFLELQLNASKLMKLLDENK